MLNDAQALTNALNTTASQLTQTSTGLLSQGQQIVDQINQLTRVAREEYDFASDQFMQWFIKEQVEEVASMSDLLTIVRRASGDPLRAEEWLAREGSGGEGADPTAPPAAA